MLTPEENKLLCQVGPGTPGGDLHRRYWQPVAAAVELKKNPVKKIRVLGEDLVLHRNLNGGYGLTTDKCPHRQVSLEYGIPTETGIRCPYHGWSFDQTGQCRETPLEPATSKLASRVCIKAYPVQEMAGMIFAYLGPAPVPAINRWDALVQPNSIRQVGYAILNCNWLHSMENSLDGRHNEYLHGHYFKYCAEREGVTDISGRPELEMKNPYTRHEVAKGEHGLINWIERAGMPPGGKPYRAIHTYSVFPAFSRRGGKAVRSHVLWRVPIDDTKTLFYDFETFAFPENLIQIPPQAEIPLHEMPTKDEHGNWLLMSHVQAADFMAWESQGEIADRTAETLGSTDAGIVAFRRLLKQQIEIVRQGGTPMNVFYEPRDMIHLEPRLGGFDQEILIEAKLGYDKYYSSKFGSATQEAMRLLKELADSGALEKLAPPVRE